MSDFFRQLNGFNPAYQNNESKKTTEKFEDIDDFDYSDVDFCQGNGESDVNNNISAEEIAEFSNIFDKDDEANYKNYEDDRSIFDF